MFIHSFLLLILLLLLLLLLLIMIGLLLILLLLLLLLFVLLLHVESVLAGLSRLSSSQVEVAFCFTANICL